MSDGPGPAGDPTASSRERTLDFIREIIAADLEAGRHARIVTRFPPEPNGFLHIGHAKSICLNFGVAAESGGITNLRFDDTNPITEEDRYVRAIQEDVRWLGFDWQDRLYFASDYYERLYGFALEMIRRGLAYVCDLSADAIREYRGTLTVAGRESPWRDRGVPENLDLFERMRRGEFPDGAKTLRAKIDMASGNLNLRDPVLYRILRARHHRTGDTWCVYPMYDFAHPLSDAIENVTHSLCTLEFEDHRPLYDWCIENSGVTTRPRQIEFARLNLTHTVLSKRRLLRLVNEGHVSGWDDPRMPTLSGLRRRGYPPEAIRSFCDMIGLAKRDSIVDVGKLEYCVREALNRTAPRAMVVLDPIEVILENYPDGEVEEVEAVNNPEDPVAGVRRIPFSGRLFIEREDFREDPPRKFFRLAPGREVRLKHAYLITCRDVVRDASSGRIVALRCTYDPETRGGEAPDGRKVRGTLHWVSAAHAVPCEVRLYDHLFTSENPGAGGRDFLEALNPASLERLTTCLAEPSLAEAAPGSVHQFLRHGYFCVDPDSAPGRPIFNRTIGLRDTWAKIEGKSGD